MNYYYSPIVWPLIGSGLMTLSLGIFALLKNKKVQSALSFAISMFIVTLWSIPNALEITASDMPVKLFWANVQYIAYTLSPVSLLFLCMETTGINHIKVKNYIKWLVLIPCITLVLVWTDSIHGLVRYDFRLAYNGTIAVIEKKYGFWFYIHAIYSHCLNFSGVVVLIRAIFSKRTIYKKPASYLLVGTSFIIIPNLVFITGLSPFKFDITPVFFGPAGAMMLWSILHDRVFELVPLARRVVIDAMDAGVVVIDRQDRVIDMNPAFKKIIGELPPRHYMESVETVCKAVPSLIPIFKDKSMSHATLTIPDKNEARNYEIILIPLYDKKGHCLGRLAMLHDVTEKLLAQEEFLKQQWQLAVIDERERIGRDLHDNLGQVLGFINMQAQAVSQKLLDEGIDIIQDKLEQLIKVTQNFHGEIREHISSIRTSVIAEKDFITSVRKDITDFEQQTGIYVNLYGLDNTIDKEFDPIIKVNIRNIIREAMNNIRKHAQARKVELSFQLNDEQMIVSVADDGKGFSVNDEKQESKNKYGLDIMKERAGLIGGYIKIESEINEGSKIMLFVPRMGGNHTNVYESHVGR